MIVVPKVVKATSVSLLIAESILVDEVFPPSLCSKHVI